MRLIIIILTSIIMQVSANSLAQKVTLSVQQAPLLKIFNQISTQTGYDFVYSEEDLKMVSPISINVKDKPLKEVLDKIFADQKLVYTLKNKAVTIKRKEESFLDKLSSFLTVIDVSGQVTDEKGKPMPGANIMMKNKPRLVVTDANGRFNLKGVEESAIIIVSYMGYKTRELPVKSVMNIRLEPANADLDEVGIISTGYQKIKKDQLTGAASTINEKAYQQRVAVTGNFLESLEGKVPGLVYNSQSGELSIRGVSTFDAVKQPLIVLDGFPTEIDLRTINPNDIVSVSVLRDAAAASIYGVRASNGVIVIETRRGKVGKPVFNLRATYAVQSKPDFNYLKYAPADEFVQLQKDWFNIAKPSYVQYQNGINTMNPAERILFGASQTDVSNPLLTPQQVDEQLKALGSYDNLKDYGNLFYQDKQAQNINFDVSGGSENNTYMLGLNYINELPVTRGAENRQIILNLANTFKFSKRFNLDFKGTYTNSNDKIGKTVPYSDFFPYEKLSDEQGNALPVSLGPGRNYLKGVNPARNKALLAAGLYDLSYSPYNELTANPTTFKGSSVRFQGRLNAKVNDWLNLDLGGNFEGQQLLTDQLETESAYSTRFMIDYYAGKDPITGKATFPNMPKGNILSKNNNKVSNYTWRAQLNFNKRFAESKHDVSGMLGAEQRRTLRNNYRSSYFGYNGQTLISQPIDMNVLNGNSSPAFTEIPIPTPDLTFRSIDYFNEAEDDRRFLSYYGQGTYIFNRKYVATGSFRIDKTNLFGVAPKYRNKPLWSVGFNWRLADEEFIKDVKWINTLQFRTATGFNGNVPTSNSGSYLILNSGLNTNFNTALPYIDVMNPENLSLRWETTRNYNFGLDYGLFDNRISGSIDWYQKRTTDVFGLFDSDPTSGFNQYNANTASIQNQGLELLINTVNLRGSKLGWRSQLTASFNHNKVLAVKTSTQSNSYDIVRGTRAIKGQPIGALYSYNYGGLNAGGQPTVIDRLGNQRVLFLAGSGDITSDDLVYSGTVTPKYVFGFNNQFNVGDFELSFLFMYYGGHVMRVQQPSPLNIVEGTPLAGSSNYWRQPGDENNTGIPGFSPASTSQVGYYPPLSIYAYNYGAGFVRKADYIRLRDVVLTYNLKGQFFKELGISNTQLRLQAQNAFRYTFSGNDIDPEAISKVFGVRTLQTQPFYSITFSTNF